MKPIHKIIETMELKSLKYSDLASYLGVGKSVVSAWKQRETNPPLDYVVQICRFLDISIYELLDIEPDSKLDSLYKKLSPDDKDTIDHILKKYEQPELQSSTSKIG